MCFTGQREPPVKGELTGEPSVWTLMKHGLRPLTLQMTYPYGSLPAPKVSPTHRLSICEVQLTTDDRGLATVPVLVTHCPPPASNLDLHTAIMRAVHYGALISCTVEAAKPVGTSLFKEDIALRPLVGDAIFEPTPSTEHFCFIIIPVSTAYTTGNAINKFVKNSSATYNNCSKSSAADASPISEAKFLTNTLGGYVGESIITHKGPRVIQNMDSWIPPWIQPLHCSLSSLLGHTTNSRLTAGVTEDPLILLVILTEHGLLNTLMWTLTKIFLSPNCTLNWYVPEIDCISFSRWGHTVIPVVCISRDITKLPARDIGLRLSPCAAADRVPCSVIGYRCIVLSSTLGAVRNKLAVRDMLFCAITFGLESRHRGRVIAVGRAAYRHTMVMSKYTAYNLCKRITTLINTMKVITFFWRATLGLARLVPDVPADDGGSSVIKACVTHSHPVIACLIQHLYHAKVGGYGCCQSHYIISNNVARVPDECVVCADAAPGVVDFDLDKPFPGVGRAGQTNLEQNTAAWESTKHPETFAMLMPGHSSNLSSKPVQLGPRSQRRMLANWLDEIKLPIPGNAASLEQTTEAYWFEGHAPCPSTFKQSSNWDRRLLYLLPECITAEALAKEHPSIAVVTVTDDMDVVPAHTGTFKETPFHAITCHTCPYKRNTLVTRIMPKKNPKTAGTGKRKAVQDQNTGNKQSRLAVLLADAISKDDEILSEIGELLGNKDKNKADGTEVPSISSESSDDECTSVSVSETSMHTAYAYEDISLGAFSAIHPPLDQKLIDKITNGEFVDFPYLLNKDHNNETTTIRKTNNATITSIQKSSPQPITEIGQWNRAFQMYADVYSAKYPTQAPHLFRYMSIIQHLANTSKHWQLYDEKFRKLRAVSPSIPWGIIHTETPFVAPLTTTQNFCQTKSCSEKVTVGITNSLGNAESQSALSPTIVATVKDPMALHVAQSHLICQRDTLSTHQTFKNQATLQPNSEKNFKLPTPVLINTLAPYLDGYDTDKTHFLVKGFNQGFSLGTADYIPPRVSQNHSSVHKNLDFVRNKIATEVTRGRIKGPYITPPLPNLVCSPLGAVPKRTKNSFRLIHDLSFPSSKAMPSVNSLIPKHNSVSSKTVFPNTQVEVHGILVDTNSLTASLPPDKVQLLRTLLESFKKRKKVTLKQLQSLLGHLNFACKVIKPGRCFLRRLYDLTIGCTKPNHHIRLTSETRADIALWHTFLNDYNGCTLLTGDRFTTSTTLKLFTDAAGSKGFACTHGSSWTFGIFPQKVKEHHINILELYPIALAVNMFGHLWQNTNICFICDNMAVVYCLNKQSSKDKTMMKLIRNIVLSALENNFCFQAKHISTKKNTICDLLSRLQVQEALTLAPHLNKTPLPLPIQMSPLALLQ
ncbi:hypothetical protein MAR_023302 [Mya arenaria]|uniref:RNase H type-1 domain-containing protein n=1 Tax=Mya arenaria TaxID=6604 RepID=A0ABY7DQT9_MYAAR|nr:hypothetical protein MAR_023302 [Mya arenaria]